MKKSYLLDSNIIIYASLPEHEALRGFLRNCQMAVSVISEVEVLGYHKLNEPEKRFFRTYFDNVQKIPLNSPIIQEAINLRQQRKMSLGDSLIAATALEFSLPLLTRNTTDFSEIEKLEVYNPLS
jgi:predicted nucleic acid-binding protein